MITVRESELMAAALIARDEIGSFDTPEAYSRFAEVVRFLFDGTPLTHTAITHAWFYAKGFAQ